MKNLKKRLRNGEALHGCLLSLGSSLTAEIIGLAGFDWVMIDLEHGAGNEKDALLQMQALQSGSTVGIIRVESNDRRRTQRALDMGAEGIIFPQAETVADVKIALSGMHYPPNGKRGVAKMVRATNFGKDFDFYSAKSKDVILGIVQIETKEILHHLDEIAALEGVDVLFIGPFDLTMSLGIFGEFKHPVYLNAVKATIAAAKKYQKNVGVFLPDPKDYDSYYDMGIRLLACGTDAAFMAQGAKNMAGNLNAKKTNFNT